jgi:hypothetical protein
VAVGARRESAGLNERGISWRLVEEESEARSEKQVQRVDLYMKLWYKKLSRTLAPWNWLVLFYFLWKRKTRTFK